MTAGVASTRAGLLVQRLACGATVPRFRRRHRARQLRDELRRRFAATRARGVCAVVEFRVDSGEAEVERFQLVIQNGSCSLALLPRRPTTTIAIGVEDLAALLEGRVGATSLFMSQRMRVSGDVLLAVRLPHFFSA
jgi:putative sterol carrier protein